MSMGYSPESIQYTVQAGDSLGNLAYEFNTTADAILAANPGVSSSTLSVGQVLSIPSDTPINAQQFWFGPGFGFGRPFYGVPWGFGYRRPFFRGPGWGYGPFWGGYWW